MLPGAAGPDWRGLYAGLRARRVQLPTYAFQRQRYWLDDLISGTPDESLSWVPGGLGAWYPAGWLRGEACRGAGLDQVAQWNPRAKSTATAKVRYISQTPATVWKRPSPRSARSMPIEAKKWQK